MLSNHASRAKQFLSFDSLKGFKELIKIKQKVVEEVVLLSEDDLATLNWQIKTVKPGMMLKVIYYDHDQYLMLEGMVSKIDFNQKKLVIVDQEIKFEQIKKIDD